MAWMDFVAKKYGGNDAYSWAVFQRGQVVPGLTGLSRNQAAYYRDQLRVTDAEHREAEIERTGGGTP